MRMTLFSSTAVALVLALTPAYAQTQDKSEGRPQASDRQQSGETTMPKGSGTARKDTERDKASKGAEKAEPSGEKGSAQTQRKEQDKKGSAESQPKDQDRKGTAQTPSREQDKGAAQTQPKDRDAKGTAQTPSREQDKGTAQTKGKDSQGTASKSEASGNRVQLSDQQKTNVHQTILKERNVNRINQVNFSISIGSRLPRSVHLVALPASVIALVPHYRSYQYFVVNDEVCIVDPASYEIVEVIKVSDRTAQGGDRGSSATLMLTEEEKHIIIENIEMRSGSTLALGSLQEGSPVPREARLEAFPDVVVQKVPKVRGHKYFTAEGRVAISDQQGSKVQLVIDGKR
jgi:hypothetical protein